MLDFLRRHQRYFFFVITIVIIISFSFFGTYSTITNNPMRDQVAFRAVDGRDVKRSEVDEMAMFISTDNTDKNFLGGTWGPNFLNNGVIREDLLQTGLAEILVSGYLEEIREDLISRAEKEKRYSLYKHPEGGFVSVANAWSNFAPGMYDSFELMRNAKDPASQAAFAHRVKLYLQEQQFPPHLLKQVLKYQERQYTWISPDPTIERGDFSLFGYHTFEDWFGSRFSRLISEFIINASIIAEQKGYHVSKEEALTDLIRNNDISYQQNKDRPNIGVANPSEYFNEQLTRMGMDVGMAVKVWQQVMLFRNYFHDVGHSVFLDPLAFQQYNGYAKEFAEIELYQLPKDLELKDFSSLQKFETYLNAVTKRSANDKDILLVPKTFLAIDEISKNNPEFVEKRYLVEIAKVDKKVLQNQVPLKETWNWEVEDSNWALLKKEFPELASKKGDTRDERFAALDSLTDKTRNRVDSFASSSIVDAHPEWLQKALQSTIPEKTRLSLRLKGGKTVISGLSENPAAQEKLMKALDEAKIGDSTGSMLNSFTADKNNFYSIKVLERTPNLEIVSFAEANRDGTLDQLVEKKLKAEYPKLREANAKAYQKEDGTWKDFADVKDTLALQYFDKIVKAVKEDYAKATKTPAPQMSDGDFAAAYRFYATLRESKAQVQKNAQVASVYKDAKAPSSNLDSLVAATDPKDQWLVEKSLCRIQRNGDKEIVDQNSAFTIGLNAWSAVGVEQTGKSYFYQVKNQGTGDHDIAVADQTKKMYSNLADDAQRMLMRHVMQKLQESNALSLDYLKAQAAPEEEQ